MSSLKPEKDVRLRAGRRPDARSAVTREKVSTSRSVAGSSAVAPGDQRTWWRRRWSSSASSATPPSCCMLSGRSKGVGCEACTGGSGCTCDDVGENSLRLRCRGSGMFGPSPRSAARRRSTMSFTPLAGPTASAPPVPHGGGGGRRAKMWNLGSCSPPLLPPSAGGARFSTSATGVIIAGRRILS